VGIEPGTLTRVVNRIWIGVIVVLAIAMLAIVQHDREEDRDGRRAAAKRLLVAIDQHELCYRERFGRYTGRTVDLTMFGVSSPQAEAASDGLRIELEASSDGRGYLQHITGDDVNVLVERRGRGVRATQSDSSGEPELAPRCGRR
jgi:hypothetical protein